ncbi:MAG: 2-C-methyl-D-erythritol 4-phosphate cytidylyltransferase [Clostridia bacterium]|nr:2-C-methyl-D-erythritol 4-phosphate cytidylyltransferase [Clostridia bacterium]MBN2883507.1 2-C-methyl-D-erythritol 4-phosphate cytidylyltransferase [Clostridia bacterium]
MFVSSVIAAGGSSDRMNGSNKLLHEIGGKPILVRTIEVFLKSDKINEIILVVSAMAGNTYAEVLAKAGILDKVTITEGGKTRMESVKNGLHKVSKDADIVLIHDAARPFVTVQLIDDCIRATLEYGAACAAVPLTDTIKESDKKGMVKRTIPRNRLFSIQTPQAFMYRDILKLHEKAAFRGLKVTDDASIAEYFGFEVYLVESDYSNIKITTRTDLLLAEVLAGNCDDTGAHDTFASSE